MACVSPSAPRATDMVMSLAIPRTAKEVRPWRKPYFDEMAEIVFLPTLWCLEEFTKEQGSASQPSLIS